MSTSALQAAIALAAAGTDLSQEQSRAAFDVLFGGSATDNDIAALLTALRDKGETAAEVAGAARSMRAHAVAIAAPAGTIDIVGTGGDGHDTVNVSTAAALVVAACGVPVAKHGNRAASSRAGSSDVLAALGVNLEPPLHVLERCLDEVGLCFLFAPRHHPAMRHVADVRRAIGTRTIFNLLGPLTNPATVRHHLIGVYAARWMQPVAEVLRDLGSQSAWIVHGCDGMDEISIGAPSDVARLQNGVIDATVVGPADAGLAIAAPDALRGGDAAVNADALRAVLDGVPGAYRDSVVLNAAAALIVADRASDMAAAATMAATAIDSGAAHDVLRRLIPMTNEVNG